MRESTVDLHPVGPAEDNRGLCLNCRKPIVQTAHDSYAHAKSLVSKRHSLINSLVHMQEREEWQRAYDLMVTVGPTVSRTDRWQAMCQWHVAQFKAGMPLKWIVGQGLIELGHAMPNESPAVTFDRL